MRIKSSNTIKHYQVKSGHYTNFSGRLFPSCTFTIQFSCAAINVSSLDGLAESDRDFLKISREGKSYFRSILQKCSDEAYMSRVRAS
jgi:hypothetical protein